MSKVTLTAFIELTNHRKFYNIVVLFKYNKIKIELWI